MRGTLRGNSLARWRRWKVLTLMTVVVATIGWMAMAVDTAPPAHRQLGSPTADRNYAFVHDPTMSRSKGVYYVFSTGDPAGKVGGGNIQIRESRNFKRWRYVGTVFPKIPAWITQRLGDIPNLWAPDISFYKGLWHLYYAGSSFGSNKSLIALATNKTLDPKSPRYHWKDRGLVIASDTADDYNAIDPALVDGPSGTKWLSFGSFWSGIKLVALDSQTGKPSSASPKLYALASRAFPDAEEGSYITKHGGYYYLFVSFGFCCRGIGSSYRIMVGRSSLVTGPYVDPNGTAMTNGGGMELQGSDQGMIGPGSGSVYRHGGTYLMDYHYYDAYEAGAARLQVRALHWTRSGWPVAGPALVPVPGAPVGAMS